MNRTAIIPPAPATARNAPQPASPDPAPWVCRACVERDEGQGQNLPAHLGLWVEAPSPEVVCDRCGEPPNVETRILLHLARLTAAPLAPAAQIHPPPGPAAPAALMHAVESLGRTEEWAAGSASPSLPVAVAPEGVGLIARLTLAVEALRTTAPPALVPVHRAAEVLGVSLRTARRRVKEGTWPARRDGRRVLVDLAALRGPTAEDVRKAVCLIRGDGSAR